MRIEHRTSFEQGARTPVGPDRRGEPETQLPHDFAAWYNDHRATVYRYIRFRVATREMAEDVTSDVFMKALRVVLALVVSHHFGRGVNCQASRRGPPMLPGQREPPIVSENGP